jgi:hypothetical protein
LSVTGECRLDQLRARATEMEVVTEKHAMRPVLATGDIGSLAECMLAEPRSANHNLDGGDDCLHLLDLRAGEKHRR